MQPLNFPNVVSKYSRLAIYGAGRLGLEAFSDLKQAGLANRICCFIDRDPHKAGTLMCGVKVLAPEQVGDTAGLGIALCYSGPPDVETGCSISALFPGAAILFYVKNFDDRWYFRNGGPNDPWFTEPLTKEADEILSLYEDEPRTISLINYYTSFKKSPSVAAFQPLDLWREFVDACPFNQLYWVETIADLKEPVNSLTYCDLGGFTGDSLQLMYFIFGAKIKRAYCFEPAPRAFRLLASATALSPYSVDTFCYNFACGNHDGLSEEFGSRLVYPGGAAEVRRLDGLNLEITGKLFIKMDIEGYEMQALEGAAETIKRHRPEMAVCVYHKADDIWTLPRYIRSLVPEYKFKLRGGRHMVLYASCR